MLKIQKIILLGSTCLMFFFIILILESGPSEDKVSIQEYELILHKFAKKPETRYIEFYDKISASDNSVVIFPIITQSAYQHNGFHDFYNNYCGSECRQVSLEKSYEQFYAVGGYGLRVLEFSGYYILDDIHLDKNPEILQKFKKVILLHNEFVTLNEFKAIQKHDNVIYLYPGSLRSLVSVDYDKNVVSLISDPNYPESERTNGFNWKFDNFEKFKEPCINWEFEKILNGYILNCNPEYLILDSVEFLQTLRGL